jgi:hypothetical protein
VTPHRGSALGAATFLLALASVAAADLRWRGENLSERGIHKGAGLPLFHLNIDGAHGSFAGLGISAGAPPGTIYWGFYQQYYGAGTLRDDRGDEVDLRFQLDSYALVQRIFVLTPLQTTFVQHYVEAIPIVLASDFTIGGIAESTAGFGDLGLGTGLLFPDTYRSKWLEAEAMAGVDVFLPTGHYRPGGLHNLSFDTYSYLLWSDLIFHLPRFGNGLYVSPAFYLAGSTDNDDFQNPVTGSHSTYRFAPAYQQLLTVLYHVSSRWSVGFEGFFDFQLADDRLDGSRIHGSVERGRMLGPLVTAAFGRLLVDVSVLREFEARNRPEGTRVTAILYVVF